MKINIFHPSDDFFTDRLCRRYSLFVFVAAAAIISCSLIRPWAFSCWCPSQFTANMVEHTSHACWNQGEFYHQSYEDFIPGTVDQINSQVNMRHVRYLPVVLVLQMLLFLLPRAFWNAVTFITGYSTGRVLKAANDVMVSTKNDASMRSLAAGVMSALHSPFPYLGNCLSAIGGYVLALGYVLTKLFYLLTCIMQMVILGAYLNFNFFAYRFHGDIWNDFTVNITHEVGNSTVWTVDAIFPRTVLCDFSMRILGNVQRYTVQCELSTIDVVEGVLFLVWIWLWICLLMLIISTMNWILRIVFYIIAPQSYRERRVSVLLGQSLPQQTASQQHHTQDKAISSFAKAFMKPDAALILEMLEDNVSMLAASELVKTALELHQQHAGTPVTGYQLATSSHVDEPRYGAEPHGFAPQEQGMYPALAGSRPGPQPETVPLVEKTTL